MKLAAINHLGEHIAGCHHGTAKLELAEQTLQPGWTMRMSFNGHEMENILKVVRQLARIGLTKDPAARYVTQIFRLALESSLSEDCLLQFVELSMAKMKWLITQAPLNDARDRWKPWITWA
jgi:hypothetical protein